MSTLSAMCVVETTGARDYKVRVLFHALSLSLLLRSRFFRGLKPRLFVPLLS
jgi:hypothetical protein